MLKKDELTEPNSCLNKAHDNEMLFVILERDPAAADTVRYWMQKRIELGLDTNDSPKLLTAASIVQRFEEFQRQKALKG
jgi:hypothetical protein